MWTAWNLSKAYGSRPSDLYNIHDELAAYSLNRAVAEFGLALEEDIRQHTKKCKTDEDANRKAQLVVDRWLREEQPEESAPAGPRKFRDPAAAHTRKTAEPNSEGDVVLSE